MNSAKKQQKQSSEGGGQGGDADGTTLKVFAHEQWPLILAAIAVLVVSACALASAGYPRGTDQFWYVADVESLVNGHYQTNNVFPANLAMRGVLPGPFVHNNVTLYLVAPLAMLFGAFGGWLATNLLCTLGTGLLIFLALRERSLKGAILTASFFLLLPMTIWLTCNALSEPIYGFLATLCMFIWLRAKEPKDEAIFMVVAVAAALAKENLGMLLLVPIVGRCLDRGPWSSRIRKVAYTAAITVAGFGLWIGLHTYVFVENIQYTLTDRLIAGIPPNFDNIARNFMTVPSTFQWDVFWGKLAVNIMALVKFDPADAPFILPFYVLLGLFFWSLVRNWRTARLDSMEVRASLLTLLLVVAFFVTAVLFQNQSRYTLFVMPSLLVSILLLERVTKRRLQAAGACALCFIPVALFLTNHIRKDEARSLQETTKIETLVDSNLAPGTPLLVVRDPLEASKFVETAYAVRPRASAIIQQSDFCSQLDLYRTRFDVRYAFGRASFLQTMGKRVADLGEDAARYARYGLYDVQSSCR